MDKPEVVKIGMQHKLKQVVDAESLTIADRPIPFIDRVKSLGVFIDSNLSFEVQIDHLMSRIHCVSDLQGENSKLSDFRHSVTFSRSVFTFVTLLLSVVLPSLSSLCHFQSFCLHICHFHFQMFC